MSTSYYPQFDCYRIDSGGHRLVVASTTLNVTNVTAGGSLGTVSVDANGIVAQGSFSVAAGTVVKFSHGTYPGTFQVTTQETQALAYSADYPEKKISYEAENLGTRTESTHIEYYALDLDDPTAKEEYLGEVAAGVALTVPYQTSVEKNLRIVPLSKNLQGSIARTGFRDTANYQDITIPPIDPSLGFRMSKFASLSAAITGIAAVVGSGLATLDIDVDVVHTTATTITVPSNIRIRYADALINVTNAGGKILITGYVEAPTQQFFAGDGQVLINNPEMWLDWWVDRTTVDHKHAMQQAVDSCYQTGILGGKIRLTARDFYFNDITLTQPIWIEGVGNGTDMASFMGAPREGTTVYIVDDDASYIFGLHKTGTDGHPRNITIAHMGFNLEDHADAQAIYIGGRQGTGGSYLFHIDRCSFVGTATTGQVFVWWNGDEAFPTIGWETIGNRITGCFSTCPENGTAYKMQSENSSFIFQGNTVVVGLGDSIAYDHVRTGWTLHLNPDTRGPSGGVYGSTLTGGAWRTLHGDITPSDQYTKYGGTDTVHSKFTITDADTYFTANDLGKGFTEMLTDWSVAGAYIGKILSPTECLLSFHPDSYVHNIGVTLNLKSWSWPQAIGGTVFKLHGNFTQFSVVNGADEGINQSFDIGAGQYTGIFSVQDYTSQGKTIFNSSINASFSKCRLYSLSFEDRSGSGLPLLETHNNYIHRESIYPAVVIDDGILWGYSSSLTRHESHGDVCEYIDNFLLGYPAIGVTKRTYLENQLMMRKCNYGDAPLSKAMISLGHGVTTDLDADEDQIVIEVGQAQPLTIPGDVFSAPPQDAALIKRVTISHHPFDNAWVFDGSSGARVRSKIPVEAVQGVITPLATPSSSSQAGPAGKIWFDANYIYCQTASGTIKRAALSSF